MAYLYHTVPPAVGFMMGPLDKPAKGPRASNKTREKKPTDVSDIFLPRWRVYGGGLKCILSPIGYNSGYLSTSFLSRICAHGH